MSFGLLLIIISIGLLVLVGLAVRDIIRVMWRDL
jgi:hypothetical protein